MSKTIIFVIKEVPGGFVTINGRTPDIDKAKVFINYPEAEEQVDQLAYGNYQIEKIFIKQKVGVTISEASGRKVSDEVRLKIHKPKEDMQYPGELSSKDISKIFVDMSKLSGERQREILDLLPLPILSDDHQIMMDYKYLHFYDNRKWFVDQDKRDKEEISSEEFEKLMPKKKYTIIEMEHAFNAGQKYKTYIQNTPGNDDDILDWEGYKETLN